MSEKFPHLSDTAYPNLENANVWQYENEFDYSKFDSIQMHVKACSVPWDLGNVHVGLKSIPMGNVVGWESKEQRDSYIDSLDGIEFDTYYRCYHDNDTIKLPIPYEYMSYFNYIVVDYSKPPVEHSDGSGITRFLFFVRDLKQLSINTTQCTIKRDSWSMFINDVDISHMQMERGHYALSKSAKVSDYLKAPADNTAFLLTPDVSFGSAVKPHEVGKLIENSIECHYVIACTSNPRYGDWGSKAAASDNPEGSKPWNTPASAKTHTEQDSPSYFVFAIDRESIDTFWENIQNDVPQFMQTVVAVYLISKELAYVQSGTNFNFAGTACYLLKRDSSVKNIGELTEDVFGYPDNVKDLTKLYTSPYCHVEFTDGEGATTRVQLENIASNELQAVRYLSIAYPFCNVKTYLHNIGDSTKKDISYYALNERNFKYSGKWYDYVWSHDIATYAIFESSYTNNLHTQWFNRYGAMKTAKNNAKTVKAASDNNADVSKEIADNSANAAVENTSTQNAANSAMTAEANSKAVESCQLVIDCMNAETANDNALINKLANASASAAVQSASISSNANVQTSLNSARAGIVNATIGGTAGVLSDANVLGNSVSALAGIASASVNFQTASTNATISSGAVMASTYVGANLTKTQAEANESRNNTKADNQYVLNIGNRDIVTGYNSEVNKEQNSAAAAITANNAATAKTNAAKQMNTTKTNNAAVKQNADNNADLQNAMQKNNAAMQPPLAHGNFTNGEFQAVKPRGVWCNVVTQPTDAIEQAGSEFKRYGYYWDGNAKFETFNVMTRYSYWKVKDIWMTAKHLPDAWVDEIRNYLLEGVTVWAKPEYINNTSIYDNERA